MLKRFVVLYCSTLGVLFMSVCLSLFFKWYDTNFRLVIPDKIYSIYLNNVGVFGRTILLSIASFGFLGGAGKKLSSNKERGSRRIFST